MRVFIIGIDGLETSILDQYIDILPNFKKIREKGILDKVNSVFPADSVPAWLTIYTGLNPAMHGIIRGKDYVESVDDFEKRNNYKLEGTAFWDKLGRMNQKCLILNPYLAYPSWPVNGIMISGPSFVEGKISKHPVDTVCDNSVYGGYKAIGRVSELQANMANALNDIEKLWREFYRLFNQDSYNLSFVLFTTLDRIQHYTWRFYDKNDPLFREDLVLSAFIPEALKLLDLRIGELMSKMKSEDHLVIISDHGFGPRPYKLINFNELLRQHGLLKIKEGQSNLDVQFKQKLRNISVKVLSKLKVLDTVALVLRKTKYFSKYKKSDFLIDKINSDCYIDENFCGKKPYCGFNFGEKIKNGTKEEQLIVFEKLKEIISRTVDVPNPKWMKFNYEVYQGPYSDRFPDICMEMPKEYGIEFDLFGKILTESVTHFKISGGHYGAGTFGYYNTEGEKKKIGTLEEFHNLILSLFK